MEPGTTIENRLCAARRGIIRMAKSAKPRIVRIGMQWLSVQERPREAAEFGAYVLKT
jgi:hypothetical protein